MNFTLQYLNQNLNYSQLFPQLTQENILDTNVLKIDSEIVTVPATNQNIQTILLNSTLANENSVFFIYLNSGEEFINDFKTIDQCSISNHVLTLTRLNNFPTNEINIQIVYYGSEE